MKLGSIYININIRSKFSIVHKTVLFLVIEYIIVHFYLKRVLGKESVSALLCSPKVSTMNCFRNVAGRTAQ